MTEKEQVKPLAPASHRVSIEENEAAFSAELNNHHRHRNYIKCCGCTAAIMLILAVIILVLIFTVFQVKNPILKMNSFSIEGLDRATLATLISSSSNLTVVTDVSVKNPNIASFKFSNATTTTVYYGGVVVGEGRNPAGVAKAKRTLRMNVTIDVMTAKLVSVDRLSNDLSSGALPISSYTRIGGRVKIMSMIKKRVVVKMNCSMTVNITNQAIQGQNCKRSVSF